MEPGSQLETGEGGLDPLVISPGTTTAYAAPSTPYARNSTATGSSSATTPHADGGVDGLPATKTASLACTFWLADALHGTGHTDDAHTLFEKLLDLRNDVGLLSEEHDTEQQRQAGNTPHAFSMVGLVNTALHLIGSEGSAFVRLIGSSWYRRVVDQIGQGVRWTGQRPRRPVLPEIWGRRNGGGACRSVRRAVGSAGAVVACWEEAGASAAVEQAAAH